MTYLAGDGEVEGGVRWGKDGVCCSDYGTDLGGGHCEIVEGVCRDVGRCCL